MSDPAQARGRSLSVVGLVGLFVVLMAAQFFAGTIRWLFGWDTIMLAHKHWTRPEESERTSAEA